MGKRIVSALFCFIGLMIIAFTLQCQSSTKITTLSSGEVVCDLNGEWDVWVDNFGQLAFAGSYPQMWKITQDGSSFVIFRMMDDPHNIKGSKVAQGELDKSGIKKITWFSAAGTFEEVKSRISDGGNKIILEVVDRFRCKATRK
jgi:hypothetical protein